MISVCMATYNGSDYIEQQLKSILPQLGVGDEIIIVDDYSTDSTPSIIKGIGDSRIKLFKNNSNVGVLATFEMAITLASGDIIFLSDQDDIWLPNKVVVMANCLENADLVVSDCIVVDRNLKTISSSFYRLRGSKSGFFSNLWRNSFLGCCIAFKRNILVRALPFPPALPMHDWWLGLVAEMFGRVVFIDQKLILYRRHGCNTSSAGEKSAASFLKQINWRVSIFFSAILRRLKTLFLL